MFTKYLCWWDDNAGLGVRNNSDRGLAKLSCLELCHRDTVIGISSVTNKQTSTTPQLISSFQQANNRVMQKDYDNNWYFLGANQENDKSSFSHFFLPFSLQNNIVNRYAKVQQPTQVTYSRQTLKSLYRYFSWQWYIYI